MIKNQPKNKSRTFARPKYFTQLQQAPTPKLGGGGHAVGYSKVRDKGDKIVLVGVLKDRRDLNILLREKWYRIPVRYAPRRRFDYLAFYQPALFGRQGKRIRYYARILNWRVIKRGDLLPDELNHARARDYYLRVRIGKIKELPQLIRNIIPRRISFGFTTLNHLLKSENILQLYNIIPTEQIVEDGLKEAGIRAIPQYYVNPVRNFKGKSLSVINRGKISNGVKGEQKRYFLDFAIFCQKGMIAIECDNKKAHSNLCQREKDKIKNTFLRKHGWLVIRLPEEEVVSDLKGCIVRIKKAVRKLGGLAKNKNYINKTFQHGAQAKLGTMVAGLRVSDGQGRIKGTRSIIN